MWQIHGWAENFENHRTRCLKRLEFVLMPNKHDGDGYTELLEHPNGAAHFGVWCAILKVASRCHPRGTLVREVGKPHDEISLSRLVRIPPALITEAIIRLIDIGWISEVQDAIHVMSNLAQSGAHLAQSGAHPPDAGEKTALNGMEWNGMEWNGMEWKRECAADAAASIDPPDLVLAASPSDDLTDELRDWLAWWNVLHGAGCVPAGVQESRPSRGVLAGWRRVKRSAELREILANRDAIEREIRAAPFCREAWFRLEKLFGGTNRDGELVVVKLLQGGYRNRSAVESRIQKIDAVFDQFRSQAAHQEQPGPQVPELEYRETG